MITKKIILLNFGLPLRTKLDRFIYAFVCGKRSQADLNLVALHWMIHVTQRS